MLRCTLQILLNKVMPNAKILKYLVAKSLSIVHLMFLFLFFFSLLLSSIFTSIICCTQKLFILMIKACSLHLPFTKIKPRARFSFSLSSFQLEHKQDTSLPDASSRGVHTIVHTHTHLLEDLVALSGEMCPSFLSAQGELEGEQEEKHLFLSCCGVRHGWKALPNV